MAGYRLTCLAIGAATILIGWAAIDDYRHRNDPPRPCSSYARSFRENVPARCFADFRPETP